MDVVPQLELEVKRQIGAALQVSKGGLPEALLLFFSSFAFVRGWVG